MIRPALTTLLVVLAGCSSVEVDEEAFAAAPPQRIAVLPLDVAPELAAEDARAWHRATIVSEMLRASLEESAYVQLSPTALRRALHRHGWEDPAALRQVDSRRLSEALGVDAVLRGRLESVDNFQGALIYRRTIAATLRLVRRDGRVLATLRAKESDTGGVLLLGHSQLLETINKTVINGTEHGFHHLSGRFSEEIVSELPQPPAPARLEEPGLRGFSVVASRPGPELRPGDRLELRAEGAPGLFVQVRLGRGEGSLALEESSPGVYTSAHVITPGEAWQGRLRAIANDRWGQGAQRVGSTRYVVAARALPAPSGLTWARRGEQLELRWTPVPGARGYVVQRLATPEAPLRRVEQTHLDVDSVQRGGSWAVLALDASGRPGVPATLEEQP